MNARTRDRIALDSAVKTRDGFFTTFFVSPYSKYLARFAARRGWSPNAVTAFAFAIGTAAAASFAVGNRYGLIAGAVLLQASFTLDCVDGQLARYTQTFSDLGAWLDSILDRVKECLVYGGLAIGAARGFDDDVWTLAAAAFVLQTGRLMADLLYLACERHALAEPEPQLEEAADSLVDRTLQPGLAIAREIRRDDAPVATRARVAGVTSTADVSEGTTGERRRSLRISPLGRHGVAANQMLERRAWTRWGKRILVLPIGERFALISVTAAVSTPRTTFVALLAWGSVAAAYAVAVRVVQSVAT